MFRESKPSRPSGFKRPKPHKKCTKKEIKATNPDVLKSSAKRKANSELGSETPKKAKASSSKPGSKTSKASYKEGKKADDLESKANGKADKGVSKAGNKANSKADGKAAVKGVSKTNAKASPKTSSTKTVGSKTGSKSGGKAANKPGSAASAKDGSKEASKSKAKAAAKAAAKIQAEAQVVEPVQDFLDFVQCKRNELLKQHGLRVSLEEQLRAHELACQAQADAGEDWCAVVAMRKRKNELEDELDALQGSMTLSVFDQQLGPFLELYSRKVKDSALISMFESNVLKSWLPSMVEVINPDVCKCGAEFMESVNEAQLVCAVCHTTQEYLDASTSSLAYGDDVEWSSFSYKRMNHLSEWLNHFQARETTRVPLDVIQMVRDALPPDQAPSFKLVNQTVRALKIPKYYDHAMQIYCHISGDDPIRLDPQTEERIRLMFMRIQQPFIKHHPPGRKNFLSYPYVVFKMLQLLGSVNVLPYVSLLKGEVVLMQQEDTWEKICNDVGWRFIPIPKEDVKNNSPS
jgi:hypothetical protein